MRILDLGSGLGYSTLWLAEAAPADATVVGIDDDGEHVALAEGMARGHAMDARVSFVVGEVAAVLAAFEEPYDFIHDDAWFAAKPAHFDRMLTLLRPGGVLTMPNWFPLEDALAELPRRDWAEFAGTGWRDAVRHFAKKIATDERLKPLWVSQPPLLVALRTERVR